MAAIAAGTALVAALPVAAQSGHGGYVPTLTVDGHAERTVSPDEAVFQLSVNTQASTLTEARTENNDRVRRLVAALTDAGIAEESIQTQRVQANRAYDWNGRERVFRGYQVSRAVTVQLDDLERFDTIVGVLLDTTEVDLQTTRFQLSDRLGEELAVRGEAVASARARAEALAAAAGRELGEVVTIVNSASPQPSPRPQMVEMRMAQAQADDGGGPITAPGEITISTTVQVTFLLK